MAQSYTLENDLNPSVNFSEADPGDIFVLGSAACVKLDNNNPNYVIIGSGDKGKLNDADQIILPNNILLKLE